MYKDIFESVRNEAEKRNPRERTIIVKNIIDYYLKALYIPKINFQFLDNCFKKIQTNYLSF